MRPSTDGAVALLHPPPARRAGSLPPSRATPTTAARQRCSPSSPLLVLLLPPPLPIPRPFPGPPQVLLLALFLPAAPVVRRLPFLPARASRSWFFGGGPPPAGGSTSSPSGSWACPATRRTAGQLLDLDLAQFALEDLAGRVARQLVEEDDLAGHLVAGQVLAT